MGKKFKCVEKKPKGLKDMYRNMADIFAKISGDDSDSIDDLSNIEIVFDKYKRLMIEIKQFISLILKISTDVNDQHLKERLDKYIRSLLKKFRIFNAIQLSEYENVLDIKLLPDEKLKKLKQHYLMLKSSKVLVYGPVIIAKNIFNHGLSYKHIDDDTKYKEFCNAAIKDSYELKVFNKISIGVKQITIDYDFIVIFNGGTIYEKYTEITRRNIFNNILAISKIGKNISKINMEPDMDMEELFDKFMLVLERFKTKIPGRSDKGFKIISSSFEIFKENFTKYSIEAKRTGDKTKLISMFFDDVTESSKSGDSGFKDMTVLNELKNISGEVRNAINKLKSQNKQNVPQEALVILDSIDDIFMSTSEMNEDIEGELPDPMEILRRNELFQNIIIPE